MLMIYHVSAFPGKKQLKDCHEILYVHFYETSRCKFFIIFQCITQYCKTEFSC